MKFIIGTHKFWIYCVVLSFVLLYTISIPLESVAAYTGPATTQSAELLQFSAERRHDGIWLEWQTAATSSWTEFNVYYSPDCQWENALVVTAPIFSSTQHESTTVVYSLLDESALAGQPCSYWIIGTAEDGTPHTFGPAAVQARFGVYLPVVRR